MAAQSSSIYGLNFKAVALAARFTQGEEHSFLVGTCNPRENSNEIHSLQYAEAGGNEKVHCTAIYQHADEVRSIVASPSQNNVFFTLGLAKQQYSAVLWRIPEPTETSSAGPGQPAKQSLDRLLDLGAHKGRTGLAWRNSEANSDTVMTYDQECIRVWQLEQGQSKLISDKATSTSGPTGGGVTAGCFDPHHEQVIVTATERSLRLWDSRSFQKETSVHERCHEDMIRDVDFNPNKLYHIATTGNDRLSKIWDLRAMAKPLRVLGAHSHWGTCIRFNTKHDQLLLTADTVGRLNLWNVNSVSSAPSGEVEEGSVAKEAMPDQLIKSFDDHDDAVYAVAWSGSSNDPWLFASLSFDGRLAINHVPTAEKFKILL